MSAYTQGVGAFAQCPICKIESQNVNTDQVKME